MSALPAPASGAPRPGTGAAAERTGASPRALRSVDRTSVDLFGVAVDALTLHEAVDAVRGLVDEGVPHQHVVLNAAKVVAMQDDPALHRVVSSCSMINADGVSIVLAGRVLRRRVPGRVTGIDLFQSLLVAAEQDGKSVYFLGATQAVLDDLVEVVGRRHPGLRIAGYRDGYWDDDAEVVRAVRAAAPDYLFLAIPSPRKEFWLHEHLEALGVPFVMGVGGSFDVLAGHISRAPAAVQRFGLEWTWRLLHEPRRMCKRYFVGNSRFLALLARTWWAQR